MYDVILDAIKDFSFGNYGCDEIDEIVADPDLELAEALAAHIYAFLELS
jgi:hypothetical protein